MADRRKYQRFRASLPLHIVSEEGGVFDTIYNPTKTKLLKQAEEAGAKTINGVEMFVRQAAAQFQMWTNLPAPVQVIPEGNVVTVLVGPQPPGLAGQPNLAADQKFKDAMKQLLDGDITLTCPRCHRTPDSLATRQTMRACRASLATAHDTPTTHHELHLDERQTA